MNKYVLIKEYKHYNLWLNTKNNCKECYWKEEDPNKIALHEEEINFNKSVAAKRSIEARLEKNYKKVHIVI